MRNVCRLGPLALVLLTVCTVRAQSFGPEIDLTTPFTTATSDQFLYLIRPHPDGYVLVFRDRTTTANRESRMVVLAPDGTVVREVTPHLSLTPSDVACDAAGQCAAVALESDPSPATTRHVVLLRFRQDASGVVEDVLTTHTGTAVAAVEATTSGFLVAYLLPGTPTEVRYHLAPASGAVGAASSAGTGTSSPLLSCASGSCLLMYATAGTWSGQRLAFDGSLLGAPFPVEIPVGSSSTGPTTLQAAGAGWATLTLTRESATNRSVRSLFIDSSGNRTTPIRVGTPRDNNVPPDFGCDSAGLCLTMLNDTTTTDRFVVWDAAMPRTGSTIPTQSAMLACTSTRQCIRAYNTSPTSETFFADALIYTTTPSVTRTAIPTVGTGPDMTTGLLAIDGSTDGSLAVFIRRTGTASGEVVATRIAADGTPTPGPGATIATGAPRQLDVVRAGTRYGLALPTSLRVLDASGVAVGATVPISPTLGTQSRMALAWNGTHYLLAYGDSMSRLMIQRFDAIFQRVDTNPIMLTTCTDLDVTSDGTGFFVLWATGGHFIRGMRLDATGASLDGATGFVVRDHESAVPRVTFTGTEYVAAWFDAATTTTGTPPFDGTTTRSFEVRAARISTAGTVLDLGGVVLGTPHTIMSDLPTTTIPPPNLAVSNSGATALVGWLQADSTVTPSVLTGDVVTFEAGAATGTTHLIDDPDVAIVGPEENGEIALFGNAAIYSRGMLDAMHVPERVRMRAYQTTPPMLDAGPADVDAATGVDSGLALDAGVAIDASTDAGSIADASSLTDAASMADAASTTDGSMALDATTASDGAASPDAAAAVAPPSAGCGCAAGTHRSAAGPAVLVLATILVVRRRRRR